MNKNKDFTEQITLYLQKDQKKLFSYLKYFISEGKSESLFSVLNILENDVLQSFKENLSYESKKALDELYMKFDQEDAKLSNNQMQALADIKKLSIHDPNSLPDELYSILQGASVEKINAFLKEFPHLSAILVQNLPNNKREEVLNKMNDDEFKSLLEQGANKESSESNIEELISKIPTYFKQDHIPLLDNILGLVQDANPKVEKILLENLKKQDHLVTLNKVIKNQFPVFLIQEIPKPNLKELIKKIKSNEVIEFLASIEEESRKFWLSEILNEESSKNQLINQELELLINENRLNQSAKDSSTKTFYNTLRTGLQEQYKEECLEVATNWINS